MSDDMSDEQRGDDACHGVEQYESGAWMAAVDQALNGKGRL